MSIEREAPWLRNLPKHWKVVRLRRTIKSAKNGIWGDDPDGVNDFPCVRVADFDRITLTVGLPIPTVRSVTHSERQGRVLQRGDLLIEKSGGGEQQPVGAVVLYQSSEAAVCSNFVARLVPSSSFDSRFLVYVHSHLYASRVNVRSIKQTTGIQNLDAYSYFSEWVPAPPITEQNTVAKFLDQKTAQIDSLIAKKARLIQLLKKKRQATIDSEVALDSTPYSITKKLKYLATIQSGVTLGKKYESDERLTTRPYLRVANVQDGRLDLENITYIDIPNSHSERHELREHDILLTEGGDFDKLGRGCLWEGQIKGCLHQNHIFAVRPIKAYVNAHFLAFVFTSTYAKDYFTSTSNQTTNLATTNSTKLRSFPVRVTTLEHQLAIVDRITRKLKVLDDAVNKVQKASKRLVDYRAALVTAAVTGQIDVTKYRGETPCQ